MKNDTQMPHCFRLYAICYEIFCINLRYFKIPIGGALMRQSVSIGGSGSTFLYGYIDAHYKKGMGKEECMELAKNAVTLAINRDGSSGGCVRY